MNKISKINFSILDKQEELGESNLEFKISGINIDYVLVNTIRRTIFTDIPIYAFDIFKFEKNTSIFHNNYLKLRLQHMPVWSIKNNVDFIDGNIDNEKLNDIKEEYDDDDENTIDDKINDNINSSSLNQLTMYIKHKNKTNEIVNVTTSHAKFYYDEKQIASPYINECLLLKLQPGQEISVSAITKMGIEKNDTIFTPVNIISYKQINDNEFDFTIESRGQLSEKRILQVALINIERNLQNFLNIFNKGIAQDNDKKDGKIDIDISEGLIIINNEDHTMGNLISRGMQLHTKVKFAGYNLPHPLATKVHFHYEIEKDANISVIIQDVVSYYSTIIKDIGKLVDKI